MLYFSKEYLNNIWNNYVVNNLDYINFAAPFLFARLLTPFRANEPASNRLMEGVLFSLSACAVHYNIENENLEDYSYSYIPVIGSMVYHNIDSNNQVVKFAGASIAGLVFKGAVDSNSLISLIPPVITYGVAKLNDISTPHATALAASSNIIDNYFSLINNPANWGTVGSIISYNLASKYHSAKYLSSSVGFLAGTMISLYQDILLDQLFTPNHFKNSYNSIAQFIEHSQLNPALAKHYIIMLNVQIGMGFYGNYLLTRMQEKTNVFATMGEGQHDKLIKFAYLSTKYVGIAVCYTTVRTLVDGINAYHISQLTSSIQNDIRDNYFTTKENFILLSKSNHTTQTYLSDIRTILSSNNDVLLWTSFGIAKLSKIDSFTLESYLGIGGVVAIDYCVNNLFQLLIIEMQKFSERGTKCSSEFVKNNEHDKEYAVTILQKNALDYIRDEWSVSQECEQYNSLGNAVLASSINVLMGFYNQDVLYPILHILVAHMSVKGVIDVGELFLYTRTLQTSVEIILFKSKNQAEFSKIDSSIDRLNELSMYLNSAKDTISKVYFYTNESRESLLIENLEFVRGNKEQATRVFIENIELFIGKIYAVTGANGSGKSSLTTLLQYVIEGISDPSFSVLNGTIIYPSSSIAVISQKDYVPLKSSLFDLIMHPFKSSQYPENIRDEIETKIIKYVNEFQVFKNPITSGSLHEVQEKWNDLSGGQKKKLFLIQNLIECPKILIMDEVFGPLDSEARHLVMDKIEQSCLTNSLLMVVWHQDKNSDNTSCVTENFFDYELHLQNEEVFLGEVGVNCLDY
ncbi:MAG: ATP-binding cassette domain-containing protein [Rickettsiales bacterium]|jgi:ABC-type lipoprotein export system ATPase subunit|nr:ATP-binding cassette domain-containing protein [Rickettsiales bacterium]